jgi:hypothetical protein
MTCRWLSRYGGCSEAGGQRVPSGAESTGVTVTAGQDQHPLRLRSLRDLFMELKPDIAALLAVADGPEPYTLALIEQLRPLTEVFPDSPAWTAEEAGSIAWIAMELVSNAIASALGSALGAATGLPRKDLLEVFGTSAIWPGPEPLWRPEGSGEAFPVVRSTIGMEPADWLRLPVPERFRSLGIEPDACWVLVSCRIGPEAGDIELTVSSQKPPLEGDLEEIRGRLADPDTSGARISRIREPHRDGEGMYHLPSFTGGGGMGLVACARTAVDLGLTLDLVPSKGDDMQVTLRLHGNKRHSTGER